MTQKTNVDVLVVGAGPTGMTAAHELARRGLSVRIIDGRPGPTEHTQAIAVQVRTLEAFDLMGIVSGWTEKGYPWKELIPRVYKKRLPTVRLDGIDSEIPWPVILGQNFSERLLVDSLEKQGVHVERNTRAIDISQNETGATVTVEKENKTHETIHAKYVID